MQDVNPKYLDIVSSGKDLFWKFGIEKVSVTEICYKAEVSRATFYKYFENKEKLALTILKWIMEEGVLAYNEIMNSDESFEMKINLTIQLKLNGTEELSQLFLNDIYKSDSEEITSYFNKIKEETFQRIFNDYQKAQLDGQIRPDIKIEFIMYALNKIHEMVTDENLSPLYENLSDKIGEIVRFFFYGILSGGRN